MGNLKKSKGEIKPSASSTSPSTVCEGRIFKVMNVLSSLSKCQEKYYGGKCLSPGLPWEIIWLVILHFR